jgi:hypothetical protein
MDATYRTWTDPGRALLQRINTDPSEDGRPMTVDLVARVIEQMPWQEPPERLPMSPGLAIQALIGQLRLPRVDLISYRNWDLAPYGLYGIQANYTDGRARFYVLDRGHDLTLLAIDFWRAQGPTTADGRRPA